jgi:hypothetical protein
LQTAHPHWWVVAIVIAIISPNVFAESIKTDSKNIKPFECDSQEIISLTQSTEHPVLKGDRLPSFGAGHLYKFYIGEFTTNDADHLVISIEETRRKSHIEDDLTQLVDYIKSNISKGFRPAEERKKTCIAYTSAFDRSTIVVQINSEPPINRSLIAGPEEHWSLSADLPINNTRQLTYDTKTSSIVEKDKPTSFYLGVNYKLGDAYTNYGYLDWRNLSGKILFKASSSPNDSMGVGIGYSLSFVDVFVARVWTKNDVNTGLPNLGTTPGNIYGLSLNVSKGISWLKAN